MRRLVPLLALMCVCMLVVPFVQAYVTYGKWQKGELDFASLDFNDMTKSAFDARMEASRSYLNYCILLTGVLWSIVILEDKGGAAKAPRKPGFWEIGTFLLAQVPLICHVVFFLWYSHVMTIMISSGALLKRDKLTMPDFTDERLSVFPDAQLYSLVCSAAIAGLLIFSSRRSHEE